jgi:hypothetical protein
MSADLQLAGAVTGLQREGVPPGMSKALTPPSGAAVATG